MSNQRKVTTTLLRQKKRRGEKITLLTAYDFPFSQIINQAGVDIILVSDAVGTVGMGRGEAVSVSLDEMIYHTSAVRNGAGTSMVITTMPFGSYETSSQAVETATRLMKEGGADGIHFEGSGGDIDRIEAIVKAGIPVLGHIGITKQKIVQTGIFQIQGRTAVSAKRVLEDATAFARAGVFGIILECIPSRLGAIITRSLNIPTIGIGAGPDCDGQALVTQDMLGLFKEVSPRFLKVYIDLQEIAGRAVGHFRDEVVSGKYPGPEHCYQISDEEISKLVEQFQQEAVN